jgi:hypothetical protein
MTEIKVSKKCLAQKILKQKKSRSQAIKECVKK